MKILWRFQSTRLSQASTNCSNGYKKEEQISIHKALASLDPQCLLSLLLLWHFNPQGSREPRRLTVTPGHIQFYFNPQGSREPRQYPFLADTVIRMISIHKALASLDFRAKTLYIQGKRFQSTRLSRASTYNDGPAAVKQAHFNPQGSREPRRWHGKNLQYLWYFNPQGSREPRRKIMRKSLETSIFQSTRLSRASTAKMHNYSCIYATFTCFILYIFYKSFIKLKFPRVI